MEAFEQKYSPSSMEMEEETNSELIPVDIQPMDSEIEVDNNVENEMINTESPINNFDTQPPPTVRRRKRQSMVWEHFTIEPVGNGIRRASCMHCKQSFAYSNGSKVAGTSHLKRHIQRGSCQIVLRNREKNGEFDPSSAGPNYRKPKRRSGETSHSAFDQDRCRNEITKMIIMHEYPLHMVEHPGFLAFVQNLQPQFDMISFNTIQGECISTYLTEKKNIQNLFEGIPGRISLSLDLWSSCQSVGYMFVTGQFVDRDWKLQRKLLNVIMVPYPDSDNAFSHSVAACLSDWRMDGRLFSVAVNQPLSDASCDNLRALFSVKNPLILNGQLLVGNCLAHSISAIAQDAITCMQEVVYRVRDSVKYVKSWESQEERFLELKEQLQVPSTMTLVVDDQTRWNTTYYMLLAALELKEVFSCLDTCDPDYKNAPSVQEWKHVEILCTYLKPLFGTANLLTTSTMPTASVFFQEACKIKLQLTPALGASDDSLTTRLTVLMHEKFDEYWRSWFLVLAMAVVLDPRYRLKLVEFYFSKFYGEEGATYVKLVEEGIQELFVEYTGMNELFIQCNEPELTEFELYIMKSHQSRSELDQYLEESLIPRDMPDFELLGWWQQNKYKYPTLSRIACDVLSISVCTVPSASVFDTMRKEMDSYRCSLRPETVEALICAKEWLQSATVDTI